MSDRESLSGSGHSDPPLKQTVEYDAECSKNATREASHPQRIGPYQILEVLGEGGMGIVFRAEDTATGTTVAIKTLHPQYATRANALQRFHKEARLLAEVNNPYVANLLEINEDEGIHYLVIEYVAGRSVGKLLEERTKLDEPSAVAITSMPTGSRPCARSWCCAKNWIVRSLVRWIPICVPDRMPKRYSSPICAPPSNPKASAARSSKPPRPRLRVNRCVTRNELANRGIRSVVGSPMIVKSGCAGLSARSLGAGPLSR